MAPKLHPLSPVTLGTMTWGKQADEAEAHAQLDQFVKLNGVWIDVAEMYPVPPTPETSGETERIIGTWVAKNPALRSKVAIATKIAGPTPTRSGIKSRAKTLGIPEVDEDQDFTPIQIEQACQASLKRLQTDYIDLYQLHWPSRPAPLWGGEIFTEAHSQGKYGMRPQTAAPSKEGVSYESIVTSMGKLLKEGKILSWGLSNESPLGVVHFCETAKRLGVDPPITIQNDFSLVDRRFDGALAEACSHYNVKLLAYGPLAGGYLSGKYLDAKSDGKRPKGGWRHEEFPKFQKRYYDSMTKEATVKYLEVAKKHKLTLVELALGFCATRFYMGSTIIGANSVEHMEEDFKAVMAGEKNITEEVMKDINEVHALRPNPNVSYID